MCIRDRISFYSNGSISLEKIADITGSDGEILTLGCTTEGQLYGISTAGKLYSLERDGVCTYIGTTAVSYTHLDVYKRQARGIKCGRAAACIVRDGKRGDVMIARQDEIGPDLV